MYPQSLEDLKSHRGQAGGPHAPHSQIGQGMGRGTPPFLWGDTAILRWDRVGALGSPRDSGTGGTPSPLRRGAGCQGSPGTGGTLRSLKEQGPPHFLGVLGDPNSVITLGSLCPLCTRGGTPQFPERPERHAEESCAGGDPDSLKAQRNSSDSFRGPQLPQGSPNNSRQTNSLHGIPKPHGTHNCSVAFPLRGPQLL